MFISHLKKRILASAVMIPLLLVSCGEKNSRSAAPANETKTHAKRDELKEKASFIADPEVTGSSTLTDVDVSAMTVDPIASDRSLITPLLAVGIPDPAEDKALALALSAYKLTAAKRDFSPLETFLEAFPNGRRSFALRNNLAGLYYSSGQFSKSYSMWSEAWSIAAQLQDPLGKRLASEAFAGYARLAVLFGRKEDLEPLLAAVAKREMTGAANEARIQGYEALESMNKWQEQAFKCGPFALFRIRKQLGMSEPLHPLIQKEQSTIKGTSVAQLIALSEKMDMPMAFVKVSDSDSIPFPSVVHWKMGHYSAIMSRDRDGLYVVDDTTFTQPLHITAKVLREEASGNYLVLKNGSKSSGEMLSQEVAENTWGRMSAPTRDPDDLGEEDCIPCQNKGMANWDVGEMSLNMRMIDTPLSYSPAVGPSVDFTLTYNSRDASQPVVQNYSNVGQKWTFKWLQFLVDDPTQPQGNVMRQRHSGGREAYQSIYAGLSIGAPESGPGIVIPSTGFLYDLQPRSGTRLEKTSASSYVLHYAGGSKNVYNLADGTLSGPRRIFLTQQIDASGNTLNFIYDSSFKLVKLVDALGKETIISYNYPKDPYRITSVTDPYGRTTNLEYNLAGKLSAINDTIGIQSKFNYSDSGDITDLLTPYGRTKFETVFAGYIRRLTITDNMGYKSRYEFTELRINGTGDIVAPDTLTAAETVNPEVSVPETGYSTRVTYFWDKKAMYFFEGDYTKATQYHWLDSKDSPFIISGVVKAIRKPFVNMTFFKYPDQTAITTAGSLDKPIIAASRMPDGQVRIHRAEYNSWGLPYEFTDPLGRESWIEYESTVLETATGYESSSQAIKKIMQKVGSSYETLTEVVDFDAKLHPLHVKDAAGKITAFSYNFRGQVTTISDHLGEVTTITYQENSSAPGFAKPLSVVSNRGLSTSFAYDAFDRVASKTTQDGHVLTFEYDAFDRLTKITYPDGTTERNEYRFLDLFKQHDREGKQTEFGYNPRRQLQWSRDSLNRLTQYEWCLCGALQKLTDPAGNVTSWDWNIIGQNLSKTYADGRVYHYTYDTAGRLTTALDPKGQTARYSYNLDGAIASKQYENPVVSTSGVSYTYDPSYPRIQSWTDSIGTTTYAYHPADGVSDGAGEIASVNGPWANDTITYLFDAQGRASGYNLPGGGESWTYDLTNRIATSTSVMGTMTYAYQGASYRVLSAIPTSGTGVFMNYGTASEDFRLKEITNKAADGSLLSSHSYTFTKDAQIHNWHREYGGSGAPAAEDFTFSYDEADRLLGGILKNSATGAVLADHQFVHDAADNRLSIREGNTLKSGVFNAANQLTTENGGGKVRISGAINKPDASVTVAGKAAAVHPQGGFAVEVDAAPGANHFPLVVTEADGTVTTKHVDLTFDQGVPVILTYDANGNLETVAPQSSPANPTRTYQWDAADRLVGVTRHLGTTEIRKTEFLYDGEGARVGKRELLNGVVDSDIRYLYGGNGVLQERSDDGGTVLKTYTPQGERSYLTINNQASILNFYHTRDHLGSVREVWEEGGSLLARYDYKPFGERVLVSGSHEAAKGYTGHDYHAGSGLLLTRYRAYDPGTGRWLSTDPLEEEGGMNLYGYVDGDPVNHFDSYGLAKVRINNPYTTADEGLELMREAGILNKANNVKKIKAGLEEGGKAYANKCGRWEYHHIISRYIGGAKNGLKVKLPAEYHQLITNAIRQQIPFKSGPQSAEKILNTIKIVYGKYPISSYLKL